jgi:hypothetical protein
MNRPAKNNFGKPILAGLLALNLLAASAQPAAPIANAPFYFEENRGQADAPAQFIARGRNYRFLISPAGARMILQKSGPARAVEMQFTGANPQPRISGDGELPGKINYLTGGDSAKWQTGIPAFAKVRVAEIYPGVNLLYYGNQRRLEYDFTVAPEANPNAIAIHFGGADKISVNEKGELVLALGNDEIRQPAPLIYQMASGGRKEISGGYKILDAHNVAFAVGNYDRSLPLVIDPVLSCSTYFGGDDIDTASAVAVDTNGFIYVAGETLSPQLATAGAFQTNFAGGAENGDAFVAKFSNDGSNLVYCTYLGGNQDDFASSLALDNAGDVFVTGYTDSTNFPTSNALFPKIMGHAYPKGYYGGNAFVAELNPAGSQLVYSTYLGGSGFVNAAGVAGGVDEGTGIAVDSAGNAYVTGYTTSTNFPATNSLAGQLSGTNNVFNHLAGSYNAFLAKIGPGGSPLVYSTYFGGNSIDVAEGIAVDGAGSVYLAGFTDSANFPTTTNAAQPLLGNTTNVVATYDAFVAKFAPSTTNLTLVYSTFIGGTNDDLGYGVAADALGNAYVTGATESPDFPDTATNLVNGLTNNSSGVIVTTNAFLVKINPNGTNLVYSAVFGGNVGDVAQGVAVDSLGEAFVTGFTVSTNFPAVNAFGLLAATNSGGSDVFAAALNTNGTAFLYSAYLGGLDDDSGYGVAVDPLGNAYVVGQTASAYFPTLGAFQTNLDGASDAFVAKIVLTVLPPQITTQPTNQLVETGYSATFDVAATGTPPLSYQWQLNGTNLANGASVSGVTNATLTIDGAQTNDSGNYSVIVTNYGGAVTSDTVTLAVTSVPFFTLQPVSQTVGVGSTVTFAMDGDTAWDIDTESFFPYWLQWVKDGTNLVNGTNASGSIVSGATNTTLAIQNAQISDSGTYWCVFTNDWGSAISSNATLTVLLAPSFTSITPQDTNGDFILSGVGGTNDGIYFVLASTNLVTPLALWTPIATNQFGDQGQFIFTNTAPSNTPQLFYILQMQLP